MTGSQSKRSLRRGLLFAVAAAALWHGVAGSDSEPDESAATGGEPGQTNVVHLEIRGAIGPATSDYVFKGIEHAENTGAGLIILEMDTPGGLDSAMREIIKAILSSDIPVATFVAPSGSRAASAGTYILYASHIAAMAPATNLGAATPVQIGAPGTPGEPEQPAGPDGGQDDAEADTADRQPSPEAGKTAMEKKAINDAVAYIRGLAEMRGRNADWAEAAVRDASSLSAEAALEQNVIDLVADSVGDLLRQIDGRTVTAGETEQTLRTAGAIPEKFEPDWRIKLLATITDPNVAYMLLLAGIYGLIFEGYNPGAIVPGVVGAICLLLALFAFQVLPVNYAGLALIVLGVMLIVAEAFAPSFGALGLGGIAAFVFGSIILLDSDVPGMQIAVSLIVTVALVASTLLLAMIYLLMRMRRRGPVSGVESMLGEMAEALEDFEERGAVFINGERWTAHTNRSVRKGDRLIVRKVHGLELEVSPADS